MKPDLCLRPKVFTLDEVYKNVDKLSQIFQMNEVSTAFLFGSLCYGTSSNDMDIGVFFKNKRKPPSTLKLSKIVPSAFNCPACHHISEMMQIYMQAFLREISQDENLWKLYENSSETCIPHYVMVLQIAAESFDEKLAPLMKRLVEKQIKTLEKVLTELSIYIEKQDYHFSSEERTKTERAIGESLTKIVGRQGTGRALMNLLQMRGIIHEITP